MPKKILLTGANGFLGSHITDALLRWGYEVRAMVRSTSNLQWLENKPVEIVYAALDEPSNLRKAVKGVQGIIHNAGIVSVDEYYHYFQYNSDGTRNLAQAAVDVSPKIKRFVLVSSQAAGGPTLNNVPRSEDQRPEPITAYGKSKLLAENHLRKFEDKFPISIIRPPALYGPRDYAWLPLFQMITKGFLPLIGQNKKLTMTHVQDVARQVMVQLEDKKAIGEIFHAAPFEPTSYKEFGDTISKILCENPRVIPLNDQVIKYVYPLLYPAIKIAGIKPPFRKDKLPDLFAPGWTISGEKAESVLGFEGKMPLLAGVGQTVEWYRWKKWVLSKRDRLKNCGGSRVTKKSQNGKDCRYDPTCDLCGLSFDGEIKTKKHYEDDKFIIVDCLICNVPMAVLKEHRSSFTEDEKKLLMKIFEDIFEKDQHPDFTQRRIPEHAHVHYRTVPHALPWQKRPE